MFNALGDVVAAWAEEHNVDHITALNMLVALAAVEAHMNWAETAASPAECLRRAASFYVEQMQADEQIKFHGNVPTNQTIQ